LFLRGDSLYYVITWKVDFSGNHLTDEGAHLIMAAFLHQEATGNRGQTNGVLKELNFSENDLDNQFCSELAEFIAGHEALERVHIGRGIDSDGVRILCGGLTNNLSLTELDLRNNQINDVGGCLLMDILKHHGALKLVDLSGNKLRDATLTRFCEVLPLNTTLQRLTLDINVGITNAAASNLIVAVRDNPGSSIERIDLGRTSVKEATIDELVKALTRRNAFRGKPKVLERDQQKQADIDFEDQLEAMLSGGSDAFLQPGK